MLSDDDLVSAKNALEAMKLLCMFHEEALRELGMSELVVDDVRKKVVQKQLDYVFAASVQNLLDDNLN